MDCKYLILFGTGIWDWNLGLESGTGIWDWNLVVRSLLTWVVRDELDNRRSLLGMVKAWSGV